MIEALLGDEVDEYGGYIAEVIYGANDGIITTFAVVAGVAGAALDPAIVLILGFANLLADGFSMGASNYLSQRSSQEYQAAQNDVQEIDRPPAFTAATTFAAFVFAGWTPLLPYLLGLVSEDLLTPGVTFPLSLGAAAVAFFVVGASRSIVTNRTWYRAGGEMLTVGMVAAAVAYVVGSALGGLA
ncbi:VIT1/CCC1 transporter family protein [Natronomonas salina]|uniref:VIT1/CCC1 transporter family protein n=1 Tax=Natronomonas salina TaxID=1710540 RepID=UPI0015B5AA5E|nr:VIT1/CCC1 transporter family protein [Natronomonas salina]QLD89592.1 VIT1/CCC1 transporter family protein [Natronomonas salina]